MTKLEIKLAEFLLALVLLIGCYFWVRHDAVADYKKEVAAEQAKSDKLQQAKYDDLAADYAILKAQRTTKYKTITKTVEKLVDRPVYKNQCIDTEGLEAANKALGGQHE